MDLSADVVHYITWYFKYRAFARDTVLLGVWHRLATGNRMESTS